MQRVGFLPRLGAFLIDLGIFTVAIHLLLFLDVVVNTQTGLNNMGLVSLLGGSLLLVGYGFCEVLMAATPGKRLAGLVIAAENGGRATRGVLARRWAVKHVAVFFAAPTVILWTLLSPYNYHFQLPAFVAFGVEVLAVVDTILTALLLVMDVGGCFLAFGPSRQALHDKLGGTAVYRAAEEAFAPVGFAAVVTGPVGAQHAREDAAAADATSTARTVPAGATDPPAAAPHRSTSA